MKKLFVIAILLMASLTVTFAQSKGGKGLGKGKAIDPEKRAEGMVKLLDKDGNGTISKEEFAAAPWAAKMKEKGGDELLTKIFTERDKNKDGQLDLKELAVPMPRRDGFRKRNSETSSSSHADALVKELDKDGSGTLSREEFFASPFLVRVREKAAAEVSNAQFNELDKNGNGMLSREEFASFPSLAKAREKAGTDAVEKNFATLDKNHDGQLDASELTAPPRFPDDGSGSGRKGGKGGKGDGQAKPE